MDKKTLANAIILQLGQKRGKKLNKDEKQFLMQRMERMDVKIFNGKKIEEILPVLVKVYDVELQKIPKVQTEGPLDMHEILTQELEQSATNNKITLLKNATWDSLLQTPAILQSIINPSGLKRTAYFILDRKFQAKDANNITEFRWNVTDISRDYDHLSSVVSTTEIQNIIGMKMYPFVYPSTTNAITSIRRISVEVAELNMQAYIAAPYQKRFHFMFETQKITTDPYSANNAVDSTLNDSDFNFHDPITELNSITLKFGNPFRNLSLDPDTLAGTIASVGAQTVITFAQPHHLALGDTVVISDFITSSPTADAIEIEQINSIHGWATTALTSTSATIDVDLSGLAGAIINNPYDVYLESKRFAIRLDVIYLRPS